MTSIVCSNGSPAPPFSVRKPGLIFSSGGNERPQSTSTILPGGCCVDSQSARSACPSDSSVGLQLTYSRIPAVIQAGDVQRFTHAASVLVLRPSLACQWRWELPAVRPPQLPAPFFRRSSDGVFAHAASPQRTHTWLTYTGPPFLSTPRSNNKGGGARGHRRSAAETQLGNATPAAQSPHGRVTFSFHNFEVLK